MCYNPHAKHPSLVTQPSAEYQDFFFHVHMIDWELWLADTTQHPQSITPHAASSEKEQNLKRKYDSYWTHIAFKSLHCHQVKNICVYDVYRNGK